MTRPRQHEIDESGKRLFQSTLPNNWVIREQHPDYRIDYLIEPFQQGESTGKFFAVQLKSEAKPKYILRGTAISLPLETKHLEYWCETMPLPVLLVVVDTTKGEAWWLPIQMAMAQLASNWRGKVTKSVHIPVENRLECHSNVLNAVDAAFKYLRENDPGSLEAALAAEKRRLELLDDRIAVSVATEIRLTANEGFEFAIDAVGPSAVEKLHSMLDSGLHTEFEKGELFATGSPLLAPDEHYLCAMQTGTTHSASLEFTVGDSEKGKVIRMALEGTVTSGRKQSQFDLQLKNSPLSIVMTVAHGMKHPDLKVDFTVSRWAGRDIRALPYISPLNDLVTVMQPWSHGRTLPVLIDIFIEGNPLIGGTGNEGVVIPILQHSDVIRTYFKAHIAARAFNTTIVAPKLMTTEDRNVAAVLYELATKGQYYGVCPNFKMTLFWPKADAARRLTEVGDSPDALPFSFRRHYSPQLFGQSFEAGMAAYRLTDIAISNVDEIESNLKSKDSRDIEIRLSGTANSKSHLELVYSDASSGSDSQTPLE